MATKPFINVSACQQAAPTLSIESGIVCAALYLPAAFQIDSIHTPAPHKPAPTLRAEARAPA